MPSEEEEDEVNQGMRTEQIAEMINRQRLHIRKDGQPVTSNQVYAVIALGRAIHRFNKHHQQIAATAVRCSYSFTDRHPQSHFFILLCF